MRGHRTWAILLIGMLLVIPMKMRAQECDRVFSVIKSYDLEIKTKRNDFEKVSADPKNRHWVKRKIAHMVDLDQYTRFFVMETPHREGYSESENKCFWKEIGPRWQEIDLMNTNDLSELMEVYGWLKISEFGEKVSSDAWLLAQHADNNRPFQRRVLLILEGLYPQGEVLARHYAYLYDRVTWYGDNRAQRYATQGACKGPSNWQPHPTEDIATVDERRATMGIAPLAENKTRLDKYCH